MNTASKDPLDRLLHDAYPAVEVSPDFTLRLWRKLMARPASEFWKVPVPALAAALLVGIVGGVWTWRTGGGQDPAVARVLARSERLDLFGNAPYDSLSGVVLRKMEGADA